MDMANQASAAVRGKSQTSRGGITLVEMLVVVAIIGILMAMLMPALNSARESGRQAACQSNLRQFGVAMQETAQRSGKLCTGAFDWIADGAPTEVGWVADLVNNGVPVGKMLCPSNPAKLSRTYNDLLGTAYTSSNVSNNCVEQLGNTAGETRPDGSTYYNPVLRMLGIQTDPAGRSRAQIVAEDVLGKSYNTNYTASWFLARTSVRLSESGQFIISPTGCSGDSDGDGAADPASRVTTFGPLQQARADGSVVPGALIPLLGCGGINNLLAADVGSHQAGEPVVEPMTRGPVVTASMGYIDMSTLSATRTGAGGWWSTWNATLQDYRAFAPVHRGTCNVLFADGGVRTLVDKNSDKLVNNGFGAVGGFNDATVEATSEDIVSKWSLTDSFD